jgi:DNA replication protein DnaC
LLILDDWDLAPFTVSQRRDMLELLEDRYGNRSTLVTSQMPVDKWHALIVDPTLGDAILDRLVHNAYRIELKGESMRRRATKLTAGAFRLTMQTCVAALRLPVQVYVDQVSK